MQSLKAAYDFPTSNPSGYYPYAVLVLREGEGEFASTAHNLRRHGFVIRVYQEQSAIGQGVETAEDISSTVLDELLTALDRDTTLSGACKYVRPVSWNTSYENREFDVRVLELQLDAYDLVTVV